MDSRSTSLHHLDVWAGVAPRRWQSEAYPLALQCIRQKQRGVISAIMGAGKSRLQSAIAASGRGRVLVTVPTVKLVEQMAATMAEHCPGEVGRYYTYAKQADQRVTVCCMPSVPALLADPAWPGAPALWICDEAHKSECSTILDAHRSLNAGAAIAFTATPFRAKMTEELSLWSTQIYEYGAKDAFRDGVVVAPRVRHWTGAAISDLDAACLHMIRGVLAEGPGLINARDISDAESFASTLRAAGIAVDVIHSRQRRADQTPIIDRLRTGDLQALVHVNMLSEGVDFPWLRWLCMRRRVGSRVRFCQEVGRVLRAYPGKTEAILLDPHDLFDTFGLTYEAVLEGMAWTPPDDLTAALLEAKAAEDADDTDADDSAAPTILIRRIAAWRSYLRRLHLAAVTAGLIDTPIKSTAWRKDAPSDKQRDAVRYAVGGLLRDTTIPPDHRRLLKTIGDNAATMRKGDVSDLLGIGFVFKDARREKRNAWQSLIAAATEVDS